MAVCGRKFWDIGTKMKKVLDKEVKICYNKSRCENNYNVFTVFEPLAQAAEHLPFKQGVPGSIPGWLTKIYFTLLRIPI